MVRSFDHTEFPLRTLLQAKREPISIVLPAREVGATVGEIVERILSLEGLVDQVLVVDAGSQDGTSEVAARAGAEVVQESEIGPELGPVLGKGDAMWRALGAVRGEVVAYLDSDTREFEPHFVTGMVGPLIAADGVEFVKGAFRRPFQTGSGESSEGGGRVTELMARPLLSAFFPELAAFAQPLAGEVAARRTLFERLPFATGYAIETSMLLHARDEVGVERMAQVDLDVRHNEHQELAQLGPMAYAVLRVVLERLRREGRLLDDEVPPLQAPDGDLVQVELVERPPYAAARVRA